MTAVVCPEVLPVGLPQAAHLWHRHVSKIELQSFNGTKGSHSIICRAD